MSSICAAREVGAGRRKCVQWARRADGHLGAGGRGSSQLRTRARRPARPESGGACTPRWAASVASCPERCPAWPRTWSRDNPSNSPSNSPSSSQRKLVSHPPRLLVRVCSARKQLSLRLHAVSRGGKRMIMCPCVRAGGDFVVKGKVKSTPPSPEKGTVP